MLRHNTVDHSWDFEQRLNTLKPLWYVVTVKYSSTITFLFCFFSSLALCRHRPLPSRMSQISRLASAVVVVKGSGTQRHNIITITQINKI